MRGEAQPRYFHSFVGAPQARVVSYVNRTSSSIRDLQNRATDFHSFVGAPQARVVSYVNGTLINADDADKENQRNRRHLRPFSFIRGAPQAHGVSSKNNDERPMTNHSP